MSGSGDLYPIMKSACHIHSLSAFLPEQVITNADLAKIVDTNNQWIVERTGISERRKIANSDNASDLGLRAALLAIDQLDFDARRLTHVIVATCTPDYLTPSTASMIAGEINAGPVMAFDINAACTGFIYGLSICRSILAAEPDAQIMFICVEALTRRLNWQDRSTCVLFGDGSVAALLNSSEQGSIFSVADLLCESDGAQKDLIVIGGGTASHMQPGDQITGDFFLQMQGRETYKHAVRNIVNVCREILDRNHLSIQDVNLFIPHQANLRIIEAVGTRLEIPMDRVFTNVSLYGNTSAASIPIAIAEARAQNRIKTGDLILISAFGAGLTWGAGLLRWQDKDSEFLM